MKTTRILLVEDDADCAEGLRETLADSGLVCLWAASPAAAMANMGADPRIGILVLDLHLPGLDGIRLLGQLRQAAGARGTSVQAILCSGSAGMSDLSGALHSGVQTFLPKPIERTAMLNAVAAACDRYEMLEHDRLARRQIIDRYRQVEETLGEIARNVAGLTAPPAETKPAPEAGLGASWHALHCRRLQEEAERTDRLLERLRLDMPEWRLLLALRQAELTDGPATATAIALASGTSATAGLRRVAALEARGLITRQTDAADGRRVLLALTPTGASLCCTIIDTLAKSGAAA